MRAFIENTAARARQLSRVNCELVTTDLDRPDSYPYNLAAMSNFHALAMMMSMLGLPWPRGRGAPLGESSFGVETRR